jgi:general secretion pathway protein A
MYLEFYNLKKEPFQVTPDPEFIYLSESHKEALASIIYGTEQKKGFIAITGAVGVGKTTVLRLYLASLQDHPDWHVKTIYALNPNVTFQGLLKTIYRELGVRLTTKDTSEMVNRLHRILVKEYKDGNNVVLIIDEAQNMPVETLENLRMLSNLETATDKLVQIVLVGQPELDETLNRYELRQLKQRIAVRALISPLTIRESREYITHRLQKAGSGDGHVFTEGALRAIVNHGQGIPRAINIVCDNSLITGFGYQEKPVTVRVVREVLRDLGGERRGGFLDILGSLPAYFQAFTRRSAITALSALLLVVLMFLLWPTIKRTLLNVDSSRQISRQAIAARKTQDQAKADSVKSPYPFVSADNGEYAMLCEKATRRLYLYVSTNGTLAQVNTFPQISLQDRGVTADVPQGVYFLSGTTTKDMATNDEADIMIVTSLNPASSARKSGADKGTPSSGKKGVVGRHDPRAFGVHFVVHGDFLKDLPPVAKKQGTPVVVVDRMQPMDPETQKKTSKELREALEVWRKAWENKDAERYFGAYAHEFVSSGNMNLDTFRRYKKGLFNARGDISVKLERVVLLLSVEDGGGVAVARFYQKYRSKKFKDASIKALYLRKGGEGWKIAKERTVIAKVRDEQDL